MQRLVRIAGALDAFIDFVGRWAAWASLALVCLMAYNVLLRYFFHTGSVALQEMEWHIMAFLVLICMSYTTLRDGHVQVDILFARFPAAVQRVVMFVASTLIVFVAAILLKLSIPYVLQSYGMGEGSPDPGGLGHRWLLKGLMPLGFALLLVQTFSAWLRALAALIGGTPPPSAEPNYEVTHAA
jgi:TRAP-type mannitol/chloroaromatic compound transport system permease small subunit